MPTCQSSHLSKDTFTYLINYLIVSYLYIHFSHWKKNIYIIEPQTMQTPLSENPFKTFTSHKT